MRDLKIKYVPGMILILASGTELIHTTKRCKTSEATAKALHDEDEGNGTGVVGDRT